MNLDRRDFHALRSGVAQSYPELTATHTSMQGILSENSGSVLCPSQGFLLLLFSAQSVCWQPVGAAAAPRPVAVVVVAAGALLVVRRW